MNRLSVFLLLAFLFGAGLFLLRGNLFRAVVAASSAESASPERRPTAPGPGLGVSSCAAAACHHGNGSTGQRGSEYTTWAQRDPHAQAFAVLFDERSRIIQDNLNRAEPVTRRTTADQNLLCLRCHAPASVATSEATARLRREDGVGCESCHGAADQWADKHFRRERWNLSAAEKKSLGFQDLGDLHGRAEICITCHVGGPGQEVDHDLIAAGHPRLQFELSSYLAALPVHWTEKGDNAKPAFATRAWAAGQIAAARADLRLLAERATTERPWPEFAQHDCLACHHDLVQPHSRVELAPRRVPGTVPANTWYLALLPALAQSAGASGIPAFDPLLDALAQPLPDRKRVTTLTDSLNQRLESLHPAPSPELILSTLDRSLTPEPTRTWDELGQCFLALAAWRRSVAVGERPGQVAPKDAAEVDGLLQKFRAAFPRGFESPRSSPSELEHDLRALVGRLRKP